MVQEKSINLNPLGFPFNSHRVFWTNKPGTSGYYHENSDINFNHLFESSITINELCIADLLADYGYILDELDLPVITDFIFANPQLINDLKTAPEIINTLFKDCKLKLTLFSDEEEEYCNLNILILNDYPVEKAFLLEEELFNKYFKTIYLKHKGKLNIREESVS